MPGKCIFSDLWLTNEDYKNWLEKVVRGGKVERHRAKCRLCVKEFDIGNMGEAAVISHMQGKKHQNLSASSSANPQIVDFLRTRTDGAAGQSNTEVAITTSSATKASSVNQAQATLTTHVTRNDTWTAEILWALKTVVSRYSYKSCEKLGDLFHKMFRDSKIAEAFACGEKKCAYIICFGLAPYFRNVLLDKISDVDFVLLFDESLNHKTQNKQMDIYVRYFNEDLSKVSTRYFDSAFIGHSTADDLMNHFMELTRKLNLSRMVQLSMDGPNVNWSFFDKLSAELMGGDNDASLINIGSCGLHIIHGAFKDACHSVDWDIAGLLKSMNKLFKDTSARRDDFMSITGSTVFPAKHCQTRWIEDVPVAKKAIDVLPHMVTYVETILKNPKKYTVPKTQAFEQVKKAVQDPLTLVKLHFFVSLAEEFLPFLSKYQTDDPVLPFLCTDLEKLLRDLMRRCIKSQTLSAASSVPLLLKVDVSKGDVLKSPKHVDVGFSGTHKLKELCATKKISERQALEFQMECRTMIVSAIKKLVEKSPLKFTLVRNVVCIAPPVMASKPEDCKSRFSRLLSSLVNYKRLQESTCDRLIKQYDAFLLEVAQPNQREFKEFDPQIHRLDDFLRARMVKEDKSFELLWKVIKLVLILSHGQASVERGFSINKGLLVDNIKETSICAQRVVHDHVQSCGGLLKVQITREVISAAQSGRMKYNQYLEERKKEQLKDEGSRKRKLCLDKIHELERKRTCLEQDIESLCASADKLAESAEKKGNMLDLTKSNSFRRTAKSKREELEIIDAEIKRMKDNLH